MQCGPPQRSRSVGRSHPQSGLLQGPLKARGREGEARAFERLLFARSLVRALNAANLGTINALSLRFCPFVLSIFHPSPLACCPLFRDRRRARGGGGGGARGAYRRRPRRGGGLHPLQSVFAAPSSGQRRTPLRATKIYFLSRSTGILYDVISCIKEAGSAALPRANS